MDIDHTDINSMIAYFINAIKRLKHDVDIIKTDIQDAGIEFKQYCDKKGLDPKDFCNDYHIIMSNILGINGMLNMIERDLERHFFIWRIV